LERGIRISKITAKLDHAVDLAPVLGKLQQHGIVKIVFDPTVDEINKQKHD
jgi:hypothetical protein